MFNREVYLYSNISFKLSSVHDYRLILRRMSNPKFLISNKKRKKKKKRKKQAKLVERDSGLTFEEAATLWEREMELQMDTHAFSCYVTAEESAVVGKSKSSTIVCDLFRLLHPM